MQNPRVLHLIMDSLRYWVPEITSTAFGSTLHQRWPVSCTSRRLGAFFEILRQDR